MIRISDSFTIRKIVPSDIAIRYFKGEYINQTIPEQKIQSTTACVKIGKDIGKDFTSEIYKFSDKNNNNQIILTTNHALYKYVMDLNNDKADKANIPILKCKYCKRGNLRKPIGIPISMTESNEKEVIFFVIDSFCDFGCAFSHLKRKVLESHLYRGPLYMNAEQMLYCMYYRMYPDRIGNSIQEKPDWELLRENGGPLNDEEFDSDASNYIPLSSISIYPVKRQYIKLNLKNAREK